MKAMYLIRSPNFIYCKSKFCVSSYKFISPSVHSNVALYSRNAWCKTCWRVTVASAGCGLWSTEQL